jgi:hypothetical protein
VNTYEDGIPEGSMYLMRRFWSYGLFIVWRLRVLLCALQLLPRWSSLCFLRRTTQQNMLELWGGVLYYATSQG